MRKAILKALVNAKIYIDQNDLEAAEAALDWAIEELRELKAEDLDSDEEQNDDNLSLAA